MASRVLFQLLCSVKWPCTISFLSNSFIFHTPSFTHNTRVFHTSMLCHRLNLLSHALVPDSYLTLKSHPWQTLPCVASRFTLWAHCSYHKHSPSYSSLEPLISLFLHQPISSLRTGALFYFLCTSSFQYSAWHKIGIKEMLGTFMFIYSRLVFLFCFAHLKKNFTMLN